MASILIRNGQLVSALDTVRGDILVQDGTIKAIGTGLSTLDASTRVIDAAGATVEHLEELLLPVGHAVDRHRSRRSEHDTARSGPHQDRPWALRRG